MAAYWQGCGPLIARGALLTAGQMCGYDGTKTFARRSGLPDGPALHVAGATVAGALAATFSAPADVLLTRYQSQGSKGLLRCAREIWAAQGQPFVDRKWLSTSFREAKRPVAYGFEGL